MDVVILFRNGLYFQHVLTVWTPTGIQLDIEKTPKRHLLAAGDDGQNLYPTRQSQQAVTVGSLEKPRPGSRYWLSRNCYFLDPPDRFFGLCKQGDSFEHFEWETEVMSYALLTNIALSQYETLKRVFCFALDLKKINPALDDNSTCGAIIGGLKQKNLEKNAICVLDNRLRNIVAHGDRFVLDGRFAYMDDEKQTMSYKDLKSA